MSRAALLPLLVVSLACGRLGLSDSFTITDLGGHVTSAELRLCGAQVQLTRSDRQLRTTKVITCEGSGNILVRLSDGRETSCPIGYVTTGAGQTWEYVVENGQCSSVLRPSPYRFELSAGNGGPGTARFLVMLRADGLLSIDRLGVPLYSDLAKRRFEVRLDAAVMEELTSLAVDSDDFDAGCVAGEPNGVGARLEVIDKRVFRECRRAATWPNGPKTQRFLAGLNETLPSEWHVH